MASASASASASSPPSVDNLYGSCSCGRNQYVISIPLAHTRSAAVYFDNGSDGRLTHGAPITAFLRVPLAWYSSSTHAYTPHETPSSIARVFAPLDAAPSARRTFCGYCGTPLTYWTDQPDGEGAFMSVPVGSLRARDQEKLEALGLLPEDESSGEDDYDYEHDDAEEVRGGEVRGEVEEVDGPILRSSELLRPPPFSVFHRTGNASGISWFEDMIQGSRLGRTQRARRGMGRTPDDSARVSWEVSEWNDAGSGGFGSMGFSSSHHASMSGGGGGFGFSSTTMTLMSSTSTSTSSTHVMSSTSGEGSREFGNPAVKRKTPEIEELE